MPSEREKTPIPEEMRRAMAMQAQRIANDLDREILDELLRRPSPQIELKDTNTSPTNFELLEDSTSTATVRREPPLTGRSLVEAMRSASALMEQNRVRGPYTLEVAEDVLPLLQGVAPMPITTELRGSEGRLGTISGIDIRVIPTLEHDAILTTVNSKGGTSSILAGKPPKIVWQDDLNARLREKDIRIAELESRLDTLNDIIKKYANGNPSDEDLIMSLVEYQERYISTNTRISELMDTVKDMESRCVQFQQEIHRLENIRKTLSTELKQYKDKYDFKPEKKPGKKLMLKRREK